MHVEFVCPKCGSALSRMSSIVQQVEQKDDTFQPMDAPILRITQKCTKCKYQSLAFYSVPAELVEAPSQ